MMKKEVLDTINIKKLWEKFDFNDKKPDKLNEQESLFISVKNSSYDHDWSLPESIEGWVYCTAWFDHMVSGQPGRRGATRLQQRPDMGKPIILDGYNNDNHGASMWFVPKVDLGGNYAWQIRSEVKLDQGLPALVRLFAEKKN